MHNNYNFIAPYYDFISRLVYGNTIIRAQTGLLSHIMPNSNVLIVGGGSGWILEELTKHNLGVLNITYIDSAPKMITLSKKRKYNPHIVNFICEQIEKYQGEQKFDCVLTGFLFSNFKQKKNEFVFNHLDRVLKKEGQWLYADFIATNAASKVWQKVLLKAMLLFFKTVSKVEANELTAMEPLFKLYGYNLIVASCYYHHFIQSRVYQKEM